MGGRVTRLERVIGGQRRETERKGRVKNWRMGREGMKGRDTIYTCTERLMSHGSLCLIVGCYDSLCVRVEEGGRVTLM